MTSLLNKVIAFIFSTITLLAFQNCGKNDLNFRSTAQDTVTKVSDGEIVPRQPDSDDHDDDDNDDDDNDDDRDDDGIVAPVACKDLDVVNINLNVKNLVIEGQPQSQDFDGINGMQDLLELGRGFKVTAQDEDVLSKELRIQVKDDGNSITTKDGRTYKVKIPSGSSSGLKLKLVEPVVFQNNHGRNVKFSQIEFVERSNRDCKGHDVCIIKPVIKNVTAE